MQIMNERARELHDLAFRLNDAESNVRHFTALGHVQQLHNAKEYRNAIVRRIAEIAELLKGDPK